LQQTGSENGWVPSPAAVRSPRRQLESYPYVPLAGNFRIVVAIFSYAGTLTFGVTGDGDTAADIGVLCRGIATGVAELVAAARPAPPAKRTARRKRGTGEGG
jgi:hypothetical protein